MQPVDSRIDPRLVPPGSRAVNGYTYFIATTKHVKIGKSVNVDRRFKDFLVGSPEPLSLMLVLNGNQERELHRRFKAFHVRGEWFLLCDEIRQFVADRLALLDAARQLHQIQQIIDARKGPASLAQRLVWSSAGLTPAPRDARAGGREAVNRRNP